MIKTKWDLSKLREIEKLTAPARYKRNPLKWKSSVTWKYRNRMLEAYERYIQLIKDLVKAYLPHFDPKKHMIDTTKIYVSEEADNIINNILLPGDYLNISPAVNSKLDPDEVWIDETEVLKPKEQGDQDDKN
ncbi:MAG: hypothetical protein J7L51_00465 [Desulfurococcales archaeon]|nr:hypothetical protein [Desulfurococcales archaeon]